MELTKNQSPSFSDVATIKLIDMDLHTTHLLPAFIGVLSFTLMICTMVGNIFVLYAITTNRVLKASGISNYLIANLAVSDLLLGGAVLPFSAYFVTFKTWIFGEIICHVWLSIDVLCCTASIWCLVVISYDRYVATNQPVYYRTRRMCLRTALAYCTLPWIISTILSLGPIFLGWGAASQPADAADNATVAMRTFVGANGSLVVESNDCVLFNTPMFVVGSSFFSFYLPLFIMIFLYSRVFVKIHEQTKKFNKGGGSRERDQEKKRAPTKENENLMKYPAPNLAENNKKQISSAEARITKTLAIVLICFIACWLPFFIIYIVRSMTVNLIPELVMDSFIWLGYFNSCMNPVIYLMVNINFRNSLRELFKHISKPSQYTNNKVPNNDAPDINRCEAQQHEPIVRL